MKRKESKEGKEERRKVMLGKKGMVREGLEEAQRENIIKKR